MQIVRLIYASVARPGIGYDDLRAIMERSAEYNDPQGITGLLCYSSGAFLQAIEGKRVPVNRLYNRIVADARHTDCEILSCAPIEVRSFIEWSMKMVSWDDTQTPQRTALLIRHAGRSVFEPWLMSGKQAHSFLRELAELERRRDA